jgi:SpoIID/LytB domain protein
MAYHEWLVALLIASSLGHMGVFPKTVPVEAIAARVQQDAPIRIGIAQHAQAVKLAPAGRAMVTLETERGPCSCSLGARSSLRAHVEGASIVVELCGQRISCHTATLHAGNAPTRAYSWGAKPRTGVYAGDIEIVRDDGGALSVINVLPLEIYLNGVVSAEAPTWFHPEALKAQAIIARTYALFNLGKHSEQGFDLCDQMHCQQYRGAVNIPRVQAALAATAGQVLTYRGCLAETVYHTVCGGFGDDPYRVWEGYLMPYLRAAPDRPRREGDTATADATEEAVAALLADTSSSYCAHSPLHRWKRSYSIAQAQRFLDANLGKLLGFEGAPGRLIDMTLAGRSPGGRVQTLNIITDCGEYKIKRNDIRWLFGDGKPGPLGLPSTLFRLTVKRDRAGHPVNFVFDGAGWGHGLGLCQYGADGRARAGARAAEILQAYYPGTKVVALTQGMGGVAQGNE